MPSGVRRAESAKHNIDQIKSVIQGYREQADSLEGV
jgi:hypothetical protein